MISINLLPTEKKMELKKAKENTGLVLFLITVFVLTILVIGILLWIQFYFDQKLNTINTNTANISNSIVHDKKLDQEIIFIKDRLEEKIKIQPSKWPLYLETIAKSTPADIVLYSISIDPKSKPSLKITGYTTNIDSLKSMKNALLESKSFKNIEINSATNNPDNSNLDFEMTGNL